nr:hypothetical protein [Corynebacterium lactis]
MAWWDDNDGAGLRGGTLSGAHDAGTSEIAPRYPASPVRAVPNSLTELLQFSRTAGASLDHVSSWQAVSAFARNFWLTDAPHPEATDSSDIGEFYALRHAVADQLELVEEAAAARAEWLAWAEAAGIYPAVLHARSYGAFAEAERFIDAHPGDIITGARPADADVPELVALADDIVAVEPEPGRAYHYVLSAAVAGAAASLARRPDIAQRLSEWTARWAPRKSGHDDRKLLAAQLAHGRGELRAAARIAAEVAEAPQSEPVTTTIEARQFLAYLSLEAGEEEEAVRQLRPIVTAGLDLDLTVGVLRSVRLLTALLNSAGDFEEAARIALRALDATESMPLCPMRMDIQLIAARSFLDLDDPAKALRFAEPVAHWSTLTDDEERTDAAFSIAATAAAMAGDDAHAVALLADHGAHLERIEDLRGAAKALRQAARCQVLADTDHNAPSPAGTHSALEAAEKLMERSRSLIGDGNQCNRWDLADWHDDLAYIYYAAGAPSLALDHVEEAAAGYLSEGDGEESARALLTGLRISLDLGDGAGARRYAGRVDKLLPRSQWDGHPVLDALDELMGGAS